MVGTTSCNLSGEETRVGASDRDRECRHRLDRDMETGAAMGTTRGSMTGLCPHVTGTTIRHVGTRICVGLHRAVSLLRRYGAVVRIRLHRRRMEDRPHRQHKSDIKDHLRNIINMAHHLLRQHNNTASGRGFTWMIAHGNTRMNARYLVSVRTATSNAGRPCRRVIAINHHPHHFRVHLRLITTLTTRRRTTTKRCNRIRNTSLSRRTIRTTLVRPHIAEADLGATPEAVAAAAAAVLQIAVQTAAGLDANPVADTPMGPPTHAAILAA